MAHNIYGSSRVGIKNTNKRVTALAYNLTDGSQDIIIPETINPLNPLTRSLGEKQYELSNHLGNVLVTVSDRKLAEGTTGSSATGFRAEVLFASDYYPFGMLEQSGDPDCNEVERHGQMEARTFSSNSYRYGFQGQETDKEWLGGAVSYKYRVHDARIGRFLSVDPLAWKYSHNSPYAFSENRVIDGVELEGLEVVLIGKRVTGSVGISGSSEGGILIAPDGIYTYGALALGLETNVSIASEISVTIFLTMQEAEDASGFGWSFGASVGEGVVGGLAAVESNGYWGVNFSLGFGVGVSPVAIGGYGVWTSIGPLSENARNKTLLLDAKSELLDRRTSLLEDNFNILKENEALQNENLNLSIAINDAQQSENLGMQKTLLDKKQKNLDRINENNSKVTSNNDQIGDIDGVLESVDKALDTINN